MSNFVLHVQGGYSLDICENLYVSTKAYESQSGRRIENVANASVDESFCYINIVKERSNWRNTLVSHNRFTTLSV